MKNGTKGALLLTIPALTLVLTLVLFSISKFIVVNTTAQDAQNTENQVVVQDEVFGTQTITELSDSDLRNTVTRTVSVVLGLLGMFAVLGIIIGTPLGIYFLAKNEDEKNSVPQNPQNSQKM